MSFPIIFIPGLNRFRWCRFFAETNPKPMKQGEGSNRRDESFGFHGALDSVNRKFIKKSSRYATLSKPCRRLFLRDRHWR